MWRPIWKTRSTRQFKREGWSFLTIQEKLPSASVNPVINQGFKLVLNRLEDVPELLVTLILLLLTLVKVEYLRGDIFIPAKLACESIGFSTLSFNLPVDFH